MAIANLPTVKKCCTTASAGAVHAVPQGAGKPYSPKVTVKTWKDYSDFKMIILVQGGGLSGVNKEEEKNIYSL